MRRRHFLVPRWRMRFPPPDCLDCTDWEGKDASQTKTPLKLGKHILCSSFYRRRYWGKTRPLKMESTKVSAKDACRSNAFCLACVLCKGDSITRSHSVISYIVYREIRCSSRTRSEHYEKGPPGKATQNNSIVNKASIPPSHHL